MADDEMIVMNDELGKSYQFSGRQPLSQYLPLETLVNRGTPQNSQPLGSSLNSRLPEHER